MQSTSGITISNRIVSGFPLSIATSQAFESIFPMTQVPYDKERKIPEMIDIAGYDAFYININTLFRNFVSACDKDTWIAAHPEDVIATIEEEMETIETLFDMNGAPMRPRFYYSEYKGLEKDAAGSTVVKIPSLRLPSTENQRYYEDTRKKLIYILEEHTDSVLKLKDELIPERYERAIIITHQPYDLTRYDRFATLDLLESNTGILKPRQRWNTKYAAFGMNDLSLLPFNKKLLYCFGDKVQIKPANQKLRQIVLDTAKSKNWHPMTTLEKVNLDMTVSTVDPFVIATWKAI